MVGPLSYCWRNDSGKRAKDAGHLPAVVRRRKGDSIMNGAPRDRRVERTRSALLNAFRALVLENRFELVSVGDVASRAHVGRSTLYEHFAGKDALLASSIAAPFAVLADVLRVGHDASKLVILLEHFWQNRPLARAIFLGPVRRKTVAVLVGLIEARLRADGLARRGALILPTRLASVQLAEMLLAPVIAWLLGESRCTSAALAASLHRVAGAALQALKSGAERRGVPRAS
jgi:AcrR family transcriptional regulator